ncbi:hypothetical protein LJR245_007511 [Rhizobium leguminosarum]|uniref:hypothetical protein n=1 Tax=Rhizobium leguminosarum TaxID=384 RepID=UPI003ECF7AAB
MAKPVIDEDKFVGSDKGIVLPARSLGDGGIRLQLSNFDRSDPPNYAPNGVPRGLDFNRNVLAISASGKMPAINVACDIAGFQPSAQTPIYWRLQTLHVLARFKNVGSYHYQSRVVPLDSEWTGSSESAIFTLFADGPIPAGLVYDNLDDRVAGGHAVLTIAAKPDGSWLQDFVHLRIAGTNPDAADIRADVKRIVAGRNAAPLENMLNAIFAWEANMKQFEPKRQSQAKFGEEGFKKLFDWPDDPPNFPVAAFDFGVGISQFTNPAKLTTPMAWDWRANIAAGANEFFDHLKAAYKNNITWADWALVAWRTYNGSGAAAAAYAQRLANSPDGKAVPKTLVSKLGATTLAPINSTKPPPAKWPLSKSVSMQLSGAELSATSSEYSSKMIGDAASLVAGNRETLAWMWPRVLENLHAQHDHASTAVIPGLSGADIAGAVAGLTKGGIGVLADAAFDHAWSRLAPASAPAALAAPSSLTAEWNSLSDFVRRNIGQGRISDWANMRGMMLNAFGAPNDAPKAIQRINAYYGAFVLGHLQQGGASMRVHAKMAQRMQSAQTLIIAKGAADKLADVSDIGGFNIRPNANDASKPSLHSFGIAIDLDPTVNPNMAMAKAELARWTDLVKFLTGIEPYGDESKRLRTPRSYDASLADVNTLCKASADYVVANKGLSNLAAAVCAGFQRDLTLVISTADANKLLALAAPPHPDLGGLKDKIASLQVPTAKRAAMGDRMVYAMQVFTMSQKPNLKPAVTGTAATTARHGFINLPAEVICGLAAEDGGGLRWLGTSTSTKDHMHFDFRDADQPPLY